MSRNITRNSIIGLVNKLNLPSPSSYTQDWEYEVADSSLAIEMLKEYDERKDLSSDEKFTLMYIILESVDAYISEKEKFPLITELKKNLLKDYSLHEETLVDFASWELDLADAFAISSFAREVINTKDYSVSLVVPKNQPKKKDYSS